jgi:glycosyltransferase involved in cell wall biosynthesis
LKVLLAVHGFPPELKGGTELVAAVDAAALAKAGCEVVVVTGTLARGEGLVERDLEVRGDGVRIHTLARPDLHFDHWHKSKSGRISAAFEEILREERPDVVHVHHWTRLSRDLVLTAARRRVPSVVTLHDHFTTCLVTFRVPPSNPLPCEVPLAADPCLGCAAYLPPETPWVGASEARLILAERTRGLARELELASCVLVPSQAHGEALARAWAPQGLDIEFLVSRPACELEFVERARPKPPVEGAPLVVAAWGQVSALKGIDLLIQAVSKLPPGRVRVELAGREQEPGWLDAQLSEHPGVELMWHGAFERERLGSHPVSTAHLMVSATRAQESHGLVLDEARVLGMPAVLPAAGAFVERAAEGGCKLYKPQDVESLAAALDELYRSPSELARLEQEVWSARVVRPHERAAELLEQYETARIEGVCEGVTKGEWYDERMSSFAEEEWDQRCSSAPSSEA